MSSTQVLSRTANGITFADPTDRDFTVRFKTTTSVKNTDGKKVENIISEIICNDINTVSVAGVPVSDVISIRLRVSGSEASMPRIHAILKAIFGSGALESYKTENVLLGFEPKTMPVNPAVV